jgi:DNA-binding MarR family transcriptional regulator
MTSDAEADEELVDAFALASRALVAVTARSLAALSEVEITLPQYRALVLLATRGPQRVIDLAGRLDVNASTASRMVDRLVRKKLVGRRTDESDRRATTLELTDGGSRLVSEATRRRRLELGRILHDVPLGHREPLVEAMMAFASAAGETSDRDRPPATATATGSATGPPNGAGYPQP